METITLEQSELIQELLLDYSYDELLSMHCSSYDGNNAGWWGKYEPLNEITIPRMAKILYIGYEVEDTPEELILKHCDYLAQNDTDYSQGRLDGIIFALDVLGIKILNVN